MWHWYSIVGAVIGTGLAVGFIYFVGAAVLAALALRDTQEG